MAMIISPHRFGEGWDFEATNFAATTGWTERLSAANGSLSIQAGAGPTGGGVLRFTQAAAAIYSAVWDAPGSAITDFTMIARFRSDNSGTGGNQFIAWRHAAGANGPTYGTRIPSTTTATATVYRVTAPTTQVSIGTYTPGAAIGTWAWIRVQMIGTAMKLRIWADGSPEPSTWDSEITDATYASGGIAFGAVNSEYLELDYVAVREIVPVLTWVDSLAAVAIDSNSGGWSDFTVRMLIPASAMSQSGTKMRLTLQAGPFHAQEINAFYVGHGAAAGDAYDFEAAPVQVLFNGGSATCVMAAGATQLSDEITFAYDESKPLLVAFYQPSDPGTDGIGYRTASAGFNSYYKAGNDASTQNATGYSAFETTNLYTVRQVEVLQ